MDNLWSIIKYNIYKMTYGTYFKYVLYIKTRSFRRSLNILNSTETIDYIKQHKCSVSRYGDGELRMAEYYIRHGKADEYNIDTFQQYDPMLGGRLAEILVSNDKKCLICIPFVFKKLSVYKGYESFHFLREYTYYQGLWKYLARSLNNKLFGDSCFTRFYYHRADISDYPCYVGKLKDLWQNEDVVFIEGDKSRLGVGNDLFSNAKSIQRFLMPNTNAFQHYSEILEAVKKLPKNKLYLLALGHTATVLAYDMAKLGYWAIDIGHVDIEYEWMLMGATKKMPVKNKYVNEVPEGRIDSDCNDSSYKSQIIGRL